MSGPNAACLNCPNPARTLSALEAPRPRRGVESGCCAPADCVESTNSAMADATSDAAPREPGAMWSNAEMGDRNAVVSLSTRPVDDARNTHDSHVDRNGRTLRITQSRRLPPVQRLVRCLVAEENAHVVAGLLIRDPLDEQLRIVGAALRPPSPNR